MGHKIISLWSWDPPPTVVSLTMIRTTRRAAAQRTPAPLPICDHSRRSTTFKSMRACISYCSVPAAPPPSENGSTDTSTFKLPSGDVFVSTKSSVCWEAGVRFHLSDEGGEQPPEMQGHNWEGHSSRFSLISELTDRSLDGQDVKDLPQFSSPSEMISWLDVVTYDDEKMPPLTQGSFERGTIRSMSVNDILMIKGLIDPGVYLDFIDLQSLSQISQDVCFRRWWGFQGWRAWWGE